MDLGRDRDVDREYARYLAEIQEEPRTWRCEYCHKESYGAPPFRSKFGFAACCERHQVILDHLDDVDALYMDEFKKADAAYKRHWNRSMVIVGFIFLLLLITFWGDLR